LRLAGRDYDTIEKTRIQPWLLARDAATLAAKRERLAAGGPFRGFVGTVSEAIDLIGQYQDAVNFSSRMSCLTLPDGRFVGTPAREEYLNVGAWETPGKHQGP